MKKNNILIEVRDLSIEFGDISTRRRVVDNISFSLYEGEVLGVLGESGSGKTLSTLAILGLISNKPGIISGEINIYPNGNKLNLLENLNNFIYSGKDGVLFNRNFVKWRRIVEYRMKKNVWGNFITAIFQNPRQSLDPLMTIGTQIDESIYLNNPSIQRTEIKKLSIDWLNRVQMNNPERVYSSYPHELSGGMCQRSMIAIALSRNPKVLIADEPTTGLDATVRHEIIDLFSDLIKEEGKSMLYISHDIREIMHLSDRVIIMKDGIILEESSTLDLRQGKGTRNAYTELLFSSANIKRS